MLRCEFTLFIEVNIWIKLTKEYANNLRFYSEKESKSKIEKHRKAYLKNKIGVSLFLE